MVPLPGKETCFWTRDLFDWTVLNDTTLLVHAPMKSDAYLVKLFAPITDMDFDLRLGFQSPPAQFNMICKDGHVIARGPIPQRELIVAVRALTPTEATQLLAASKAAAHRQPSSTQAASPPKPSS